VGGVLVYNQFFRPKQEDTLKDVINQKIVSKVTDFRTDTEQNVRLNVDNPANNLPPESKLDLLYTQVLANNQAILEIPLSYFDNQFFDVIRSQVPELTELKRSNPLVDKVSIMYDSQSQKYIWPGKPVNQLHQLNINGQTKWIYIQDSQAYLSDINFANEQQIKDIADLSVLVLDIHISLVNQPVVWFYVSDNLQAEASLIFRPYWIELDLRKVLVNQPAVLSQLSLLGFDSQAKNIDFQRENFDQLASEAIRLVNNLTQIQDGSLDYNTNFDTYFFLLPNGKWFLATQYYTTNFWQIDPKNTLLGPQQIPDIQFENPNSFYHCVPNSNICFAYNPQNNMLIKFDLSKDEVVIEKGQPNLNGVKYDLTKLNQALQVVAYDHSKLLQYDPGTGELRFWYAGQWVVLGKN
jgi:hypothetical protein